MALPPLPHAPYDMVFVSEGALCWLPDLAVWGRAVRSLLRCGGAVYVFDTHPFYLMFDETRVAEQQYEIRYPYFNKAPEREDSIGGYAAPRRGGAELYSWMYTVGEVVNALVAAGLRIEYWHEFPELYYNGGGMDKVGDTGLYAYPFNKDKFPMSFSLRATLPE